MDVGSAAASVVVARRSALMGDCSGFWILPPLLAPVPPPPNMGPPLPTVILPCRMTNCLGLRRGMFFTLLHRDRISIRINVRKRGFGSGRFWLFCERRKRKRRGRGRRSGFYQRVRGGEKVGGKDFRTRSIRAVVVVHNNIVYLRNVD